LNKLGEFLERVRKEKKWSLREAAQRIGIGHSYLRDLELGINRKTKKEVTPSATTLKKIADAYSIDYYSLLEMSGIINPSAIKYASEKIDTLLVREGTGSYTINNDLIPLIGTICAGDGLLAEQNIEGYVRYPMTGCRQPDYALRVKGNSMIGAGIEDGDIVFMKYTNQPDYSGQIVAALINDNEEGTLKHIKWSSENPVFQLVPDNDDYKTIEVPFHKVTICGTYMGHFKPDRGEKK